MNSVLLSGKARKIGMYFEGERVGSATTYVLYYMILVGLMVGMCAAILLADAR